MGIPSETLTALGTQALSRIVHPDDVDKIRAFNVAAAALADGQLLQIRTRLRSPDGQWRWVSRRVTPFDRDATTGEVTHVLGVTRDITDLVEFEARLQHAALHDPLTGLANRALLNDRLDAALARARLTGTDLQLLFIDLDGFKRVNDAAGHAVGDKVLILAAERITGALRTKDTLARVGGDEFVVMVEPTHRDPRRDAGPHLTAADLAERITAALREPFVVDDVEHVVTASIGITTAGPGRGSSTAADVLSEADVAMYRAKRRGKNRVEVFEDHHRTDVLERARVERALRHAIGSGLHSRCIAPAGAVRQTASTGDDEAQLGVVSQPVVQAGTGRLVAFEALARLSCVDSGPIAPDLFVAIEEDTGIINGLGLLVLDDALAQLAQWRQSNPGLEGCTVAVIVSAKQARHVSFADTVRERLAAHGLRGSDLVLELTETALLEAGNSGMTALRLLHDDGIGIAIDDFGTGYATLRYLATLQVTAVKVDRTFTAGMTHDRVCAKIVRSVISLAKDLDLTCVVEGVETHEQRAALPDHVQLQGYLTGRPVDAADLDLLALLIGPTV